MPRTYLQLAIPSPLRRTFDYVMPARFGAPPQPGTRVRVAFGRQSVIGVVTGISQSSSVPADKLRPAEELLDETPPLPRTLFDLCSWAASYYQHPIGDVFQNALPVLLRQGEPVEAPPTMAWRQTALGMMTSADALARAPRQQRALEVLRQEPGGLSPALARVFGVERRDLAALAQKELAEEFVVTPAHHIPDTLLAEAPLTLNEEQGKALEAIRRQSGFHAFLLDGITGSGKTEVYLQAIQSVLEAGKQALVLVPEISLTPQTVARFRSRFLCEIVVLHSGLSDRERLAGWRHAREGSARIVIGTRSAIFTPLHNPGIIIIDEEHDLSFKQQEGFRYHARDLAVMRGHLEGTPVVLGSATPSLESLHNADTGRYTRLKLNSRANDASLPPFRLLDIRKQKLNEGLSDTLLHALRQHLDAGNQVLVFINRRGFAPVVLCHDCGWQMHCPRCDARPVMHRDPPHMACHHCGKEQPVPRRCPDCGSSDLRPAGIGTERLESALQHLFKHTPIWRIDRDSIRKREALEAIFHDIHQGKPGILLGTQMLAKGHHFPDVTLVAILDIDGGLFGADFRAPEHTAQLVMQVAGRAGRAGKPGEVWLQTHEPDHPMLTALIREGYESFARATLAERRQLGLPPYGYLALLHCESAQADRNFQFLEAAASELRANLRDMSLWGPVPAPMERKAGVFRAHLLLQSPSRKKLHEEVSTLVRKLDESPEGRRVRWWLDVDPQDLG